MSTARQGARITAHTDPAGVKVRSDHWSGMPPTTGRPMDMTHGRLSQMRIEPAACCAPRGLRPDPDEEPSATPGSNAFGFRSPATVRRVLQGWRQARRGRPLAAALAALTCAVVVGGCTPPQTPTLTPIRGGAAIEGGSCDLEFTAAGLTPNTTYGIGMYTTSSEVPLGEPASDSIGTIHTYPADRVQYPQGSNLETFKNAYVGLYTINAGNFQTELVSAKLTIPVCLAAGLAP